MLEPVALRGTHLHDGVAARLRAMVLDGQLQRLHEHLMAQLAALKKLRRAAQTRARRPLTLTPIPARTPAPAAPAAPTKEPRHAR